MEQRPKNPSGRGKAHGHVPIRVRMTSFSHQLRLLLWKNFTLRKRHKARVFAELAWPCALFLVLVWVRTRGLKLFRPTCHLVEKALPSVGGFEFLQNYYCTLNNTCFDETVEENGPEMWKNALFTTLISEASPILQEIVTSKEGMRSLAFLWEEFSQLIQVISGLFSKAEIRSLVHAKLGDFMGNRSRTAFIKIVSTYTLMSPSRVQSLLNASVIIEEIDHSAGEELLSFLASSDKCINTTEFGAIRFENAEVLDDICEMDMHQRRMLAYFTFRSFDKNGLAKKIKSSSGFDAFMNQDDAFQEIFGLDLNTLTNVYKLLRIFLKIGSRITDFSRKLNGTDLVTAIVYDGFCGIDNNGSLFEPGVADRYDSIRDQMQDWNPEHSYEYDPDISNICNSVFQKLESTPHTAILWRQMKPFVRGVIYYAPDTEFARKIMDKVDQRIGDYLTLHKGVGHVLEVIHRVRDWLYLNEDDLKQTLVGLKDKGFLDLLLGSFKVQVSPHWEEQISDFIRRFSELPFTAFIGKLDFSIEFLSELVDCIRYNRTVAFPTEWEAVNEGYSLLPNDELWATVVFENILDELGNPLEPNHIKYKIRMDSDKVDETRTTRARLTSKGPRRRPAFDMKYLANGFLYLQEMIEHSIIEAKSGQRLPDFSTYMQQFPYPCFIYDQFVEAISGMFPCFMVLSWVYASSMIVKSIVMEKELRLKEMMRVMGLGNGVIWCGWFIDDFVILSLSATLLSLILKLGKVIENSEFTVIWAFMISYAVATITFSFMVSTMFHRANSASAAGGLFFFISYLPYNMMWMWEDQLTWFNMLFGCLISNVAFGFGCNYLARLEEDGIGARWDHITLKTLPNDDFNLGYIILLLWVDAAIYLAIALYIEAVFPGNTGTAKPWNFLFLPSYWTGRKADSDIVLNNANVKRSVSMEENQNMEQEPEGLRPGVVTNKLCKTYSNGKVALHDLSVTFYENQITSFLGHNGAGKTTTISILTGLISPTSGSAAIKDLDICTEMDKVRKLTGICPQYNTLFNGLSIEEHLQFFAGLKGKSGPALETEINGMLDDLGLSHKRKEFPKKLSGGMKRKLSVACSFIGGSQVILIDEPTTGVDPFSRRSIWELLLKYKQGRTIVLTTHFMAEADILGDRIAIIADGRVKACGSSLFLKTQFGEGYSLRLIRAQSQLLGMQEEASRNIQRLPLNEQNQRLKAFVQEDIEDVILEDDFGSEIVFTLPYSSMQNFPKLFARLDGQLEDLGITGYGISDTTLEDVFLKITKNHDLGESGEVLLNPPEIRAGSIKNVGMKWVKNPSADTPPHKFRSDPNSIQSDPSESEVTVLDNLEPEFGLKSSSTGFDLCLIQMKMIYLKRLWNSNRNQKSLFLEIILPAIFILITLTFTLIVPRPADEAPREMTPWTYASPNTIFFAEKGNFKKKSVADSFVNGLLSPSGLGTACLKDELNRGLCKPRSWSDATIAEFQKIRHKFSGVGFDSCFCSSGSMQCPKSIEEIQLPRTKTPMSDVLYDVSKTSIPEWIVKTYKSYEHNRFGGFELTQRERLNPSMTEFLELIKNFTELKIPENPLQLGTEGQQAHPVFKVWYENRAWVSSVAYLNALHNILLRESLSPNSSKNEYGITLTSHPMNLTESQLNKESFKTTGIGAVHAICIIFALSFVPASFTIFLIDERTVGAKHLHLVSGVKPITYWVANFLYDMSKYLIPVALSIVLFEAFNAKSYIGSASVYSFVVLLILYGWAVIPAMYPFSFTFNVPSTAFVLLACLNLFIGVMTTVSTYVLEQFQDEQLELVGNVLNQLFLVFPHYCLGESLMILVHLDVETEAIAKLGFNPLPKNRFEWDLLGKHLFVLFLHGFVFFGFTLFLEYRQLFRRVCRKDLSQRILKDAEDLDEDVLSEQNRVLSDASLRPALRAENLTKIYPGKKNPAVKGLTFAVGKGECFGLLGVNGAGKSSSFKMMTGDTFITHGKVEICNADIETRLDQARRHFGYCPQVDGLTPRLNAYEILRLYGRLRGMSWPETKAAVDHLIQALGLHRCAERNCETYSGGNRRKLSTAIALIGDPDIVFLDEPTSGMDPVSRRQFWKVILRLVRLGKSCILTSHSMEECEALCSRIAIMVNGQFLCLGSLQHLKNKFGDGYTMTIRCPKPNQDKLSAKLDEILPSCKFEDKHCSQMTFSVPQGACKLSNIFYTLCTLKGEGFLEDYSVSQTTLDDIFVKFAAQQKDEVQ